MPPHAPPPPAPPKQRPAGKWQPTGKAAQLDGGRSVGRPAGEDGGTKREVGELRCGRAGERRTLIVTAESWCTSAGPGFSCSCTDRMKLYIVTWQPAGQLLDRFSSHASV